MVVLVGLWASKDDHDTLNVRVAVLVIFVGMIFPLLRVATLRCVLASINDLMFVSVAVPSQVVHREAMVLAHLVHDLVEFLHGSHDSVWICCHLVSWRWP